MPIVTAIIDSRVNFSLFSIYVDDKFLVDLSLSSIDKFKIKIGLNLTESLIEDLKQVSLVDIFTIKSLKLISIRKRSRKEIKDYLIKNELSSELADTVTASLIEKNYINDEEFAKSFINDRMLLNPVSYLKLTYLLKAKGINQEIVDKIVSKDEINESAMEKIVTKKRKLSRFKDDKKLTSYLISQGFSYSDIKDYLAEN